MGPHFLRITDIQQGLVNWAQVPYCAVSTEDHEKYRVKPGDIFVARTGASTGENVYIINAPDSVFASYLVRFEFLHRGIGRVVGEFMRTAAYFDHVQGCMGGSAQPNAGAQVLASADLVFPSDQVAAAYFQVVKPMDDLRYTNCVQSQTLTALRDTLLPKLLSGEIRIRDAEKVVEAHV